MHVHKYTYSCLGQCVRFVSIFKKLKQRLPVRRFTVLLFVLRLKLYKLGRLTMMMIPSTSRMYDAPKTSNFLAIDVHICTFVRILVCVCVCIYTHTIVFTSLLPRFTLVCSERGRAYSLRHILCPAGRRCFLLLLLCSPVLFHRGQGTSPYCSVHIVGFPTDFSSGPQLVETLCAAVSEICLALVEILCCGAFMWG